MACPVSHDHILLHLTSFMDVSFCCKLYCVMFSLQLWPDTSKGRNAGPYILKTITLLRKNSLPRTKSFITNSRHV